MKNAYLIRHGLPEFPEGKKMCLGTTDIPMGQAGLQQAAAMAAKLPPVTAVFSSPLTRALQTARAIGPEVAVLDGLKELHAGQWDGLTFDQIKLRYPELYNARSFDLSLPLPDAEDPAAGLARFASAMESAARTAPGDFAVVAHGGILSCFLESVTGSRYKPDYVEVIHLCWDNGKIYKKDSL